MTENKNESAKPKDAKGVESSVLFSLFIGGLWDGRRISTYGNPTVVRCPEPAKKEGLYRREIIGAPGKSWVIYVYKDLTIEDAIDSLISGYKENAKDNRS